MIKLNLDPATYNCGTSHDSKKRDMSMVVVNRHLLDPQADYIGNYEFLEEFLNEIAKARGVSSITVDELSPTDADLVQICLATKMPVVSDIYAKYEGKAHCGPIHDPYIMEIPKGASFFFMNVQCSWPHQEHHTWNTEVVVLLEDLEIFTA